MPDEKNNSDEKDGGMPFHFHESDNFNSVYFGKLPEHIAPAKEKDTRKIVANLISLLTDRRNAHLRNEVLAALKNAQAADLLASILRMEEHREHRRTITAACWESGLDFSEHLDVFIDLAIEEDLDTCVEAMTVIEQMGNIPREEAEEAAAQLSQALPKAGEKRALLEEIRSLLENR